MSTRLTRPALIAAFAALLSGCVSAAAIAEYQRTKPSPAEFAELKRRCEQNSGVRWFEPQPMLQTLWFPGYRVESPRLSDGTVRVIDAVNYNLGIEEQWLATGRVTALIVNVEGRNDVPHLFGPKSIDPPGWYRFEARPSGHPDCAPYDAARAAFAMPGVPLTPSRYCLTYAYVGPFDSAAKPAMLLRYEEAEAGAAGIRANTVDLIVEGRLVARGQHFTAGRGVSAQYGVEACAKPYEVSGTLAPTAEAR